MVVVVGGGGVVMKGFRCPELSAHAQCETAFGKGTFTFLAATLLFKTVTRTLKHVKSSVAPAGGIADGVAVVLRLWRRRLIPETRV